MIISIPAPLFDVNGRCSKRIFVFENERRTLARTEKNWIIKKKCFELKNHKYRRDNFYILLVSINKCIIDTKLRVM